MLEMPGSWAKENGRVLPVVELERHSCSSPLMMPSVADARPGLLGWVSVCLSVLQAFGLALVSSFLVPPFLPTLILCGRISEMWNTIIL